MAARKRKPIVKTFDCHLYNVRVHVYANCSPQELNKLLTQHFGADKITMAMDDAVGGVNNVDDDYILWLADARELSTLVHEAVHLVGRIFAGKGIIYNIDHDEPWAYYLEYWVRTIYISLNAR